MNDLRIPGPLLRRPFGRALPETYNKIHAWASEPKNSSMPLLRNLGCQIRLPSEAPACVGQSYPSLTTGTARAKVLATRALQQGFCNDAVHRIALQMNKTWYCLFSTFVNVCIFLESETLCSPLFCWFKASESNEQAEAQFPNEDGMTHPSGALAVLSPLLVVIAVTFRTIIIHALALRRLCTLSATSGASVMPVSRF